MGGPYRPRSLADLTAQFYRHVLPSRAEPRTRAKNWRYCSCAVTWAIARKAVGLLLPMSTDTLKALIWDLIIHPASASLTEAVWNAIQARHRQYNLTPPIDGLQWGPFLRPVLSEDPELDIVHQLRVWMEVLDLGVHPRCRKRRETAPRCPWCPPLLPRTRRGQGNVTVSDGYACSPQRISQDVTFEMTTMGANPSLRVKGDCRRQLRQAYTRRYSFCRGGMAKRRRRGTICIFGTRRSSCRSSTRLNCDGCTASRVCGLCASRRGSQGRVETAALGLPRPSRPHDGMVGPTRRPAAGRRAGRAF